MDAWFHQVQISTHPPRAGRDDYLIHDTEDCRKFQSTLPAWGGTARCGSVHPTRRYFNPPSVFVMDSISIRISIHPPRVGRDPRPWPPPGPSANFNPPSQRGEGPGRFRFLSRRLTISIHPPRAGRDAIITLVDALTDPFQSTLTTWEGTRVIVSGSDPRTISTHPPCVERGEENNRVFVGVVISTHPPRTRRDTIPQQISSSQQNFNPLYPCGEGRSNNLPGCLTFPISTHLPRLLWFTLSRRHFNPHSMRE